MPYSKGNRYKNRAYIALFFFSLFALHSRHCLSQAVNVDSLAKASLLAKDDTNKVNLYNDLSWGYKNLGLHKKADSIGELQLQLAQKLDYKKGQADANMNIGNVWDNLGDNLRALECFHRALEIRTGIGDVKGMSSCLNNIGNVYDEEGDYPRALDNYLQGLRIAEKAQDSRHMSMLYGNIGNVYNLMKDYDKAIDYISQGMRQQTEIGDMIGVGISNINLAAIYYSIKDYQKSLQYAFNAYAILKKMNYSRGVAASLNNIGNSFKALGQNDSAEHYLLIALQMGKATNDKDGLCNSEVDLGSVYENEKKYALAQQYTMEGIANAKDIGSLEFMMSGYNQLYSIASAMGDNMRALGYYKTYIQERDSLYNQNNTQKIVRSEMNFDFEKKQAAEKADQDKKDALQAEQDHRQKLIIYFISGIALLVLGFAVFAYRSYLQKQKANTELDEKNHKIEGAYTIIEDKNREITDSINYAKRIQSAMLPSKTEIQKAFPSGFVLFKPKDIVSGDFFFFAQRTNGEKILAAADCTGHGVPGAFMSLIGSEKLKDAVEQGKDAGDILGLLNKGIRSSLHQSTDGSSTRDGMDIALCTISPAPLGPPEGGSTMVGYSGANRPLWIIRNGRTEIEEIKATKWAIGGFTEESQKFQAHEVKLNKGDAFYIFSDGYADQFGGPDGKKLTTRKFRELLLSLVSKPMHEQESALRDFIESWQGSREQLDDILVIGVRV
jgi:serine phosphatase RsbU (regulator of sigma subunit)